MFREPEQPKCQGETDDTLVRLRAVADLRRQKQKEHVQNCGTSLDMMLAIPTEEGRQMRKVQKKSDHKPQLLFKDKKSGQNFPKPQSTLRTRSQNLNREAETQLVGESKNKTLNPVNGKKKNQKRAGSAGPPTSRKRRHG